MEDKSPFPRAQEMMSSTIQGASTNVNDWSNVMTGLDTDTDWMFDLGLASFTPHDVDFSTFTLLPASNL